MEVQFTVTIDPRPMPRPRFAGCRAYFTKEIREYQSQVKAAAEAMSGRAPLQGAVSMRMKFFRKVRADTRRAGDADNLAKAVMDALNGVCYKDDGQITFLQVEKKYSDVPRVEVEIWSAD